MEIDIDEQKAKLPLSNREKIALHILLMVFYFIAPAKYAHQITAYTKEIKELLK